MRKLFAFNMVSLDGCFEGPNQDISWHNADEEFNQFAIEQTSTVGTILFGRRTYEGMASYWPTEAAINDDPVVAELMNSLPKIVFSRTLQKAEWKNSTLIKDNIAEEILKLKRQPGKEIAVFGSADLLSTLIQLDLIDEHRIIVNPVVLGSGTPLFKNVKDRLNLKLTRSRTFDSGNVLLYYQPNQN
ncbi:MAG TPA: dihydrofolate reductase family protein [Anaerolineales bacterium]|nr:dihydrofolate reductase family protein [Anaerolineales bacterium]